MNKICFLVLLVLTTIMSSNCKQKNANKELDNNINEIAENKLDTSNFENTLVKFLDECFWNKNFDLLVMNNDDNLVKYIDAKQTLQRYYNPGSAYHLYSQSDNYGFDFQNSSNIKVEKLSNFVNKSFSSENNELGVYFQQVESVPDNIDNETLTSFPVKIVYENAIIYKVEIVAQKIFKIFYFIQTPNGWKLAFIDDRDNYSA